MKKVQVQFSKKSYFNGCWNLDFWWWIIHGFHCLGIKNWVYYNTTLRNVSFNSLRKKLEGFLKSHESQFLRQRLKRTMWAVLGFGLSGRPILFSSKVSSNACHYLCFVSSSLLFMMKCISYKSHNQGSLFWARLWKLSQNLDSRIKRPFLFKVILEFSITYAENIFLQGEWKIEINGGFLKNYEF